MNHASGPRGGHTVGSGRRKPLLRARALWFERRLLFGSAALYAGRLDITGWTFRGPLKRSIPLGSITEVRVDGDRSDRILYLKMQGREAYTRLTLARGASLWRVMLTDLSPSLAAHGDHPDAFLHRARGNETSERIGNGADQVGAGSRPILRRVGEARSSGVNPPVSLPPAASN